LKYLIPNQAESAPISLLIGLAIGQIIFARAFDNTDAFEAPAANKAFIIVSDNFNLDRVVSLATYDLCRHLNLRESDFALHLTRPAAQFDFWEVFFA